MSQTLTTNVRSRRYYQMAFTLVELLVVILLPALSKARGLALIRLWVIMPLVVLLVVGLAWAGQTLGDDGQVGGQSKELNWEQKSLLVQLKESPFKIVHESFRDGNWELILRSADGSGPVNLTKTADIDELYPHASPDGTKIAFVADSGQGDERVRHVYTIDVDGSNRTQVGENGRQPFWSPDGKVLAFLRGERLTNGEGGSANKEMYFYNVANKELTQHPKQDLAGLLNPCWTPDGKWIISSVMGGMGFSHSICAIEAHGQRVVELRRSNSEADCIYQCRPDVSPNGNWVAWGKEDCKDFMWLEVADLVEYNEGSPKVANRRYVVELAYPLEIYHVEWSPDSGFIAYSVGRRGTRMEPAHYVVGNKAKGWDIHVVDPQQPNVTVQITDDGFSNKEPDWVYVAK